MKLSIIIPVYNEASTLREILRRVRVVKVVVPVGFVADGDDGQQVQLEKEIIVIDDGSEDGSRQILDGGQRASRMTFGVFAGAGRPRGRVHRPAHGVHVAGRFGQGVAAPASLADHSAASPSRPSDS